jgi:heptosyltransferase-1
LDAGDFPMDIVVAPADTETAGQLCQAGGITPHYAVFCPFTTRPQKHWFEDRWAELSHAVPKQLGMAVVMLGGPRDREAGARIAAAGHGALGDLVGRTTLGQAAAVIRNAALLIGVDTGLTHLGIAFAVPTLALFGSTCPYLDPATPRAEILYHPLPCSPCRWHPTCDGAFTCMKQHTVDGVLETARRLLARGS